MEPSVNSFLERAPDALVPHPNTVPGCGGHGSLTARHDQL